MNKVLARMLGDSADPCNTRHKWLSADEVEAITEAQNALIWAEKMRRVYERRHPNPAGPIRHREPPHDIFTLRRTPPEDDLC